MKTIRNYDDIPTKIKSEIEKRLTDDILERFDNSSYHNQDIIHNTLEEFGYKLID